MIPVLLAVTPTAGLVSLGVTLYVAFCMGVGRLLRGRQPPR